MKILIVGNAGYIGPVLTRHLRTTLPDAQLIGYDSAFFAHCTTGAPRLPETRLDTQHYGDVRMFPAHLLDGIDGVVQLAAISNDPMGNRFEKVTQAINHQCSVNIARMAAERGVKRFVFASSCSMYGYAAGGARKENDSLNPLTAYARSKVATEADLSQMGNSGMTTTSLRFSTACGWSDRTRLDLVLNDFAACAVATKEITVLSDGTPWRPLIDVKDMSRAIEWALTRDEKSGGRCLAVNVGSNSWNYQVRDLAEAVARHVPGTKVSINTAAPPDKRSYRVDFSLYERLAPKHQPQVDLDQAIGEICAGLQNMGFCDPNFRVSQFIRLKVLEKHIAEHRLTESLHWS